MKKALFFAAALVVAMSSCSKSSIIEGDMDQVAIGFDSFIDKSVRATDITVSNITNATVKGYYSVEEWASRASSALYFDRVLTIATDGAASYSPTVYWPTAGGNISFFAYAPAAEVGTVTPPTTTDEMSIEFTTATLATSQSDFVTANALSCEDADGLVNLAFNHTLSKIGFSAISGDTYADLAFEVTELYVRYSDSDIANKGVYSYCAASGVSSWVPSTSSFFSAGTETGSMLNGTGVVIPTDGSTTEATNLVANNAYMMLIPQTLADKALTVTITYKTTNSSVTPASVLTTTKSIDLKTLDLKEGTYYNYIFTIGASAIKFDKVTVNAWNPGSSLGSDI